MPVTCTRSGLPRRLRSLITIAAGISVAGIYSAPAWASTDLGPPLLAAQAVCNGPSCSGIVNQGDGSQPVSAVMAGPAGGFSESSVTVLNQVALSASSTGDASLASFVGDSVVFYQFEVTGPSSGPVPVDVLANLHATGTATVTGPGGVIEVQGSAAAELLLGPGQAFGPVPGNNIAAYLLCANSGFTVCLSTQPSNLVVNSTVLVPANEAIAVEEVVDVGAIGLASATASADPFFQIDPMFSAENPDFQLIVSDGVANALPSAVPEPDTWTLMIAGFGFVGGALRRRSRATLVYS